jgi:hypothetical protein
MGIIGRLLKRILHAETGDDPYIETLDRLERARVDLMNVEDYVKDRIKTFNNIKEYLPKEHIQEEFDKLSAIKYHLERLKESIEDIEKIIQKAQGMGEDAQC